MFLPENPDDTKNLDYFKENFIGGGVKGTSKFRITEWEVYEITFSWSYIMIECILSPFVSKIIIKFRWIINRVSSLEVLRND